MYPIFLRLGAVTIRFYGIMMAAGFVAAIYIARKESLRKGLGPGCVVDFASYAIISGIVGARLYYVMLNIGYFWGQPLDIIKLWQGGLAFHGGILGGFLTGIWFAAKRKIPFWKFADIVAPGLILAQAIGRAGCFLNGCCYGRETTVPWAVTFRHPESSALLNVPLHPAQLYEMAGNLGIFFFLWGIRKKKMPDGYVFLLYAITYSLLRFGIEFFRADSMYPGGLNLAWAQVMAVVTIAAALVCMKRSKKIGKGKSN